MKKKLLLLLIAVFGVVLQNEAQTPFKVKTPPFRKFVKITANDVNLRKSPSAQSPKLIYCTVESDLGGTIDEMVWSNKPLARNERAVRATVLPVREPSLFPTVKTSSDWICGDYKNKSVYVMKKFCKEVPLRPLDLPDLHSTGFTNTIKIGSGKYKDYCIGTIYNEIGEKMIRLGKYVNGMFVFNYCIYYFQAESGKTEVIAHTNDHPTWFTVSTGLLNDAGELNLRKLLNDTQALDMIMTAKFGVSDYDSITYYGVAGDNNCYSITSIN